MQLTEAKIVWVLWVDSDMDGSNKQMQPLYNDEYGILRLMSTLTSDEQRQSQYGSLEDLPESISWFTEFKHSCLSKIKILSLSDS